MLLAEHSKEPFKTKISTGTTSASTSILSKAMRSTSLSSQSSAPKPSAFCPAYDARTSCSRGASAECTLCRAGLSSKVKERPRWSDRWPRSWGTGLGHGLLIRTSKTESSSKGTCIGRVARRAAGGGQTKAHEFARGGSVNVRL